MGTITTNAVRSEDTKNATITRAARVGLVVKRTRHFEKLSLQIIYHVTIYTDLNELKGTVPVGPRIS